MIQIAADKLALIESIHLESGAQENFEDGVCAMELVAYIADEPFSDHPECVCPVLGAFVRAWNDGLPNDERDAILKPILPRLIGSRGSNALEERRALMAANWLVRVHTPAWLRLAKLDAHADALSALPEITAFAQVPSIRGPIEAARRDADAAWDAAWAAVRAAAWDAAWAAVRAAAWDAARAAAWDAAWAAARAAAWDAAWAAAWDAAWAAVRAAARNAAWDAAWAALKETRLTLQRSAAELVERMIEAVAEAKGALK
jgi:hypothetical protein